MKRKWLLTSAVTLSLAASALSPTAALAARKGDLNNDGSVNSIDFGFFRKFLLGKGQLEDESAGDLNGDNGVNSIDFGLLRKHILGFDIGLDNNDNTGEVEEKPNLEYVEKVFGQEIMSVEILANEAEWQTMLNNAVEEEYIKVDVIVNGTKFTDVGIRPKGNSSLTQVSSMGSDRYSFRLNFDKYVEDQTCFGIDKFVLNNIMGDNTYMKEYVSMDIMKTAGVETPLFCYSNITVNGKPWGTYFAVELYGKNYRERVTGSKKGELYNVKMTGAGNNEGADQGGAQGGFGGFGADNGGSMKYKDDNPASYPDIFLNGVGNTDEEDHQQVIAALKALSLGTDLETYFDVDSMLRYLAAHTVTVNLDSFSSFMAQNYYIYQRKGQVTLLPWDYNLAWGGFTSRDVKSVVNFPIDTPVEGVQMSDRPMIDKFLSNSAYLDKYHQYLQLIVDEYFANGKFEAKIRQLDSLLSNNVQNDSTKFCTYEEYQKAVSAFIKLGDLRGQSIQGQLNGTIPSTASGQSANQNSLLNSTEFAIGDLGTMSWGGGFGGGGDWGGDFGGGDWGGNWGGFGQ